MAQAKSSTSAIDSLNTQHQLVFIGYIVVLVLAAIFSWWVWKSGNKLQDAIRQDADARISEASATAQQAITKQKEIEQENIKLAIRLEQEHQARLKLEHSLTGRSLTDSQRQTLGRALSVAGPHHISITKLGDDEASKFADQIIGEFRSAGWNLELNISGIMGLPIYGVLLEVPDNPIYAQTAEIIIESFKKAGISYSVQRGQALHLIIGLKPFPKIPMRE